MKKVYESPELEITLFDYEILTANVVESAPGDQGADDIDLDGDWGA